MTDHSPRVRDSTDAVESPMRVVPSNTSTKVPGSAVPVMVTISTAKIAPSVGVSMIGAAGSILSSVNGTVFDSWDMLSARSWACASTR